MDLRAIGWGGVDWMRVALGRGKWRALVKTIMSFSVP